MKNLLVANHRPHGRVAENELRTLVAAQMENSLALGWKPRDLVLVTNLDIDVAATVVRAPLNEFCLTGSKMFAIEHLMELGVLAGDEVWWAHDLDAWQNHWFDAPEILDIGLAEYSKPKFNGGSLFLRSSARDLVAAITGHIREHRADREEPTIDHILRMPRHAGRVTVLNSTYNVGCSAYAVRYARSHQPILVSHFHPHGVSWRTHVWGHNQLNTPSISARLLELLVRHFHGGNAPVPARKPPPPVHYRLRNSFHLGECWARLNCALRLLEQGQEFSLYLPNAMTKEILGLLDLGPLRPRILRAKAVPDDRSRKIIRHIDTGDTAYRSAYFPTKQRPHGNSRAIGYSLEASWKPEQIVPARIDQFVAQLRSALPEFELIPIGPSHQASVTEMVSALAKVRLHISVDNGVAQMARSVGVPLYLLEHTQPLKRGFPPEACAYTLVTVDTVVATVIGAARTGDLAGKESVV